jgi:hypothetical protein
MVKSNTKYSEKAINITKEYECERKDFAVKYEQYILDDFEKLDPRLKLWSKKC